MRFGVNVYVTDNGIDAVEAGEVTEAAGLNSIWLGDHSHIPAVDTDIDGYDGDPHYVDCYPHFYDQFCALTAIAVTTTTLKLGTGICLVPEREPIALAKQVATVDYISDGRLLFGVGGGWNTQETINHGTDPKKRFSVMRERILAMKEIWANDIAEYHGSHVDFSPLMSWPKPVQKPHPPIIVGGRGPRVLERVFEYGDAWAPDCGEGLPLLDELAPRIEEFNQLKREHGREDIQLIAMGLEPSDELYSRCEQLGFDEALVVIPPADATKTRQDIEAVGALANTHT
jgi:probable F420-dependent oxidoreductase